MHRQAQAPSRRRVGNIQIAGVMVQVGSNPVAGLFQVQDDGGQHQAGPVGSCHQERPEDQIPPIDPHSDPAGVAVVAD